MSTEDLIREYRNSIERYYAGQHQLTRKLLFSMVDDFPKHENKAETRFKALVIGRTYLTHVERHIGPYGNLDTFDRIAEAIFKERTKVDGWIRQLKQCKTYNCHDANMIADIVVDFENLLPKRNATLMPKTISFASKYLFFHTKTVPIFDSRAKRGLSKTLRQRRQSLITIPKNAENQRRKYSNFLGKWCGLYTKLAGKSVSKLDAEHLDFFLYEKGNTR